MAELKHQKSSKYLKFLFLFCIGIVLGVGVLLWHPFSTGYYSSLAITYGENDYPFLTIHLQNRDYVLAFDVGSRFPLSLSREVLNGIIDKQLQGTIPVRNINGQKHEVPSYLISEIKVGNLTVKNVIAHESQEKEYSMLGKFLGGEFNLLLDFPHNLVVACDTFSKLQDKKLAGRDWVRIPFEMHRSGIVFHVDTDFGTRRLIINTTSTLSHLHSSFIPSGKPYASSALILGGRQFGNVTFESINLPDGLREIDGFIGMDFLKEHAVYFDYVHKIAYVEPPKKYFERIPITLGSRNNPIIDVSIEGNLYPLKLDLGSSFHFSLCEKVLQKVHKIRYGSCKWHDFRGKQYESPTYTIPEIKIGNLTFSHVLAHQDSEDFHANASFDGPPLQFPGVIGLPILEKYNLFLDFPHAAIYASNDHLSLQQAGLLSKNLLAIPFTLHPDGIIFDVETDAGTFGLMLDTGSTFTVIRTPHPADTEKFCIMGHDFGERSVKVLDVNPQFDFDGVLGMDFLLEYPLFIDYLNKRIFIDLQKDN